MKRLSWILTIPLTLVAVVFAVANREVVSLDLWPLEVPVNLPLFVAVLGSLFAGLLAGGAVAWLSAGKARRRARDAQRRASVLAREVARLERERDQRPGRTPPGPEASPGLPAPTPAREQATESTKLPAITS